MSSQQNYNYLVLFFTHSGAVKYRRLLSTMNLDCEMMPVPRKLSSSCGVCITFKYNDISSLVTTDIERIYKILDKDNYAKIYDYS